MLLLQGDVIVTQLLVRQRDVPTRVVKLLDSGDKLRVVLAHLHAEIGGFNALLARLLRAGVSEVPCLVAVPARDIPPGSTRTPKPPERGG